MNAKRGLLIIGVAGITAAATGCKDQPVRDFLAENGRFHKELERMSIAICELEEKHPPGLDAAKRICPGGPPDRKTIPSYPQ